MPWLIIVTGRPASGKSTLAKWLGEKLAWPAVSKDDIKEILFDQLGWSDREWSKELGRASVELMFHFAKKLLETQHSLILDNVFHTNLASPRFRDIKQRYKARSLQIVCNAPDGVLFDRFRERAIGNLRHPGHVDLQCLDEYRQSLKSILPQVLDIGGEIIEVDTTDWAKVRYENILEQVQSIIDFP
jgi:predicted kinase